MIEISRKRDYKILFKNCHNYCMYDNKKTYFVENLF